MESLTTKYSILEKYFGYSSFREGQELLIDAILSGQDVLGIMPTGAGKSICYQVPALMLSGIPDCCQVKILVYMNWEK